MPWVSSCSSSGSESSSESSARTLLLQLVRRIVLPNPALYPLRTLAFAGVIYGAATVAHGSGFLAVYIGGILIGDADIPAKRGIERFHTSLASLAEIVVFVAMGLTVDLTALGQNNRWLDGLVLAVVLAFVARPLAVGPLLVPARLTRNERLFVMWSGLKGAVPILLASFVVLGGVTDANRIYGIVFVVVAFSVAVAGRDHSVGCGPSRDTDALDDSGLAAVALDAKLVSARARDRAARAVERQRSLHGREHLAELGAALAHDRETGGELRDPDDLLGEDRPRRHYDAARSANFA